MSINKRLGLAAALAVSVGLAGCAAGNDHAAAQPPVPAPAAAPAMPAAPSSPAKPMSAMERNAGVQTALNSNGAHLKVDGHMGAKSRAALRAFQHKNHLKPTGRPDAATLKALGL